MGGANGNKVPRRIDAGSTAGRCDCGELSREFRTRPSPRVEENAVAVGQMVPYGARQDIARRKFRPWHAPEKGPAGFVDEGGTFAANSLADQRHRAFGPVKRGRVELDELEVGKDSSRAGRKRQALSATAGWIGGV
ncbi:hypothetical protein AJ88_46255 [Mesorhizobium amorphae CCBAU 01583]|nr:hypothetical protein AJ88_46255 [Mesorhizobium amorphae CCBAU 01583]